MIKVIILRYQKPDSKQIFSKNKANISKKNLTNMNS